MTDLNLSGTVAQYGRGMMQDVSTQLVSSFADCLQAQMESTPEEARQAREEQAKPVAGLSLAVGALRRAVARLIRRRSQ